MDVDPYQAERDGKVREVGGQAVWSLSSCKPGTQSLLDSGVLILREYLNTPFLVPVHLIKNIYRGEAWFRFIVLLTVRSFSTVGADSEGSQPTPNIRITSREYQNDGIVNSVIANIDAISCTQYSVSQLLSIP